MSATIYFDSEPESGFDAALRRSASALRELGVGPGDVVALMLQNEPVLLELMLAARQVGAYFCLVNWHFKAGEVGHILRDSGAKVLVVHTHLVDTIREALTPGLRMFVAAPRERTCAAFDLHGPSTRVASGQEAWETWRDAKTRPAVAMERPGSAMLYTSGTTGQAKGIRRQPPTPEQAAALTQTTRIALGIEQGMRALLSAPIYHAAPASYAVQAALHDAHLWIAPRFDAEETLRLIEAQRLSHAYLVPTMFRRLLAPAARSAQPLRPVVAALHRLHRRALPGRDQAAHDRMVGPGDQRKLCAPASWATSRHIASADALRKPGSAGRAIPGTRLQDRVGVRAGTAHRRSRPDLCPQCRRARLHLQQQRQGAQPDGARRPRGAGRHGLPR